MLVRPFSDIHAEFWQPNKIGFAEIRCKPFSFRLQMHSWGEQR